MLEAEKEIAPLLTNFSGFLEQQYSERMGVLKVNPLAAYEQPNLAACERSTAARAVW